MSTSSRFVTPVPFARIKNLKIEGITVKPGENDQHVLLMNGKNCLHASTGDGSDTGLDRYGMNEVSGIIQLLEEEVGAILSEYDDGFFTDEEENELAAEAEANLEHPDGGSP